MRIVLYQVNLSTLEGHGSITAACEEMHGLKFNNNPSAYGDGKADQKMPLIIESGETVIPTA